MGHGLTGAALGLLATPAGAGRGRLLATLVAFAALANIPDLPLPGWGHSRYDISHSVFVNLPLALVLALALWRWRGLRLRVTLLGAAAWCSHLLLDSMYNHGKGVAIFWPLSAGRLALPRGEPIRLTFIGLGETPNPRIRSDRRGFRVGERSIRAHSESNAYSLAGVPGDVRFLDLPAGHYRVLGSRGPLWSLGLREVEIRPGEETSPGIRHQVENWESVPLCICQPLVHRGPALAVITRAHHTAPRRPESQDPGEEADRYWPTASYLPGW